MSFGKKKYQYCLKKFVVSLVTHYGEVFALDGKQWEEGVGSI